jgi:hypothetical protein
MKMILRTTLWIILILTVLYAFYFTSGLLKMTFGDWCLFVTAVGEVAIAFVIFWEWEGSRLDQFLSDADNNIGRKAIFKAYCGLDSKPETPRNVAFKELLEKPGKEIEELRDSCDENIRLFSRVGARLPHIWRRRALDWHVVVILWEILGPYVEERRREAGPTFAKSFLEYALASAKHLQEQDRGEWVIRDPDFSRKRNVTIDRARLVQMQKELKKSLKMHQSSDVAGARSDARSAGPPTTRQE